MRSTHPARAPRSALVARNFQGTRELARCRLLDDESEPNPTLDKLMADAVTRLYLVANGHTACLAEKVTNGNRQHYGLRGDTDCHNLLRAFTRARTHRERLMLILAAQTELRAAVLVDRSKVRGTDEWKAKIRNDPRSRRALAVAYGVGEKVIRNIKKSGPPLDGFGDGPYCS